MGRTNAEIRAHIREWYRRRGLPNFGSPSGAWEALRVFEDDHRQNFPEYESPWQKRGHRRRNFSVAAARDLRARKAEVSQATRDFQARMAADRQRQFGHIRGAK